MSDSGILAAHPESWKSVGPTAAAVAAVGEKIPESDEYTSSPLFSVPLCTLVLPCMFESEMNVSAFTCSRVGVEVGVRDLH